MRLLSILLFKSTYYIYPKFSLCQQFFPFFNITLLVFARFYFIAWNLAWNIFQIVVKFSHLFENFNCIFLSSFERRSYFLHSSFLLSVKREFTVPSYRLKASNSLTKLLNKILQSVFHVVFCFWRIKLQVIYSSLCVGVLWLDVLRYAR